VALHLAQEAAKQQFVVVGSVDLGGVQEVPTELEIAVQDAKRLRIVGRTVGDRHPHAAEADAGDVQIVCAEAAQWQSRGRR
jgi:hypothetical protein